MKQQFLNDSGLTELIGYIKKYVKDEQDVKPYASLSVFPKTGEQNIIYIDTTVNASYYWDDTSNTYKALDVQTWANLTGKPSTFPPSSHTHDDRYFTETEMNSKLAGKANSSHTHKKADITDFPTSMPASDVPAWAKASTKPTYTKAEVGLGNVDNTADKNKSVKYATSAGSAGTASSVDWSGVKNPPTTYAPSAHTHGSGDITSLSADKITGVIGIDHLPAGALERCKIVADDTARFKLTKNDIQNGDTVKVGTDANARMYFVIDDTKLSSEAGYTIYTAGSATSVPWSGVTGKPSTFTPSSHKHTISDITNISSASVSYATSAGTATKLGTSAGSATQPVYFSDGKPVATTYTLSASVPAGAKFTDTNTWRPLGTTGDTACAGNDSRLSNARPASDVYSWAKASTKPSYNWGEITGKPGTFTPSSHDHDWLLKNNDNTITSIAKDTTTEWGKYNCSVHWYTLDKCITDQPSQYGYLINVGHGNEVYQLWLAQPGGSIAHRGGNANGWDSSWKIALDSSNYTSYTVTKSGSGASGTWGINVTGSAGSVAWSNVSGKPSSLPASDVYAWAKASSKPSYSWGEITGKPSTFTPSSHTHNYAGSSSAGGSANWANGASYANYANKIACNPTEDKSTNGLFMFQYSENTTICPDSAWWSVVRTQHPGYNNGYWQEMAYRFDSDIIKFRRNVNGSKSAWKTIAFTDSKVSSAGYADSAGSANSVAWGNVSGRPSSMPASDVYSWAKASSKPSYSWSEISGRPSSLPANGGNASTVNGHTVNANVPAGAVFTDTNTWRPCVNNLTSDSTDQSLSAAQGKILKDKLDKLVPIGYIFIWNNRKLTNFNETLSGAPDLTSAQAVHDYFGFGTWQYVGDTFLYGNPNSQGGASTVSLGVGNMPSHTHSIPALSGWAANNGAHAHNVRAKYTNNCATKSGGSARANGGGNNTSDWRFGDTDSQGTHGHNVSTNASTTGSNGSGSAFSIMPPYKGVYIWQRIA